MTAYSQFLFCYTWALSSGYRGNTDTDIFHFFDMMIKQENNLQMNLEVLVAALWLMEL